MPVNVFKNVSDLRDILSLIHNRATRDWVTYVTETCIEAVKRGNKILVCGNGGSHCDAEHFCEELTGKLYRTGHAIPAFPLSISGGHLTCVANDYGYNQVFLRAMQAMWRDGDVIIGLSTSGKSENVLRALKYDNLTFNAFLLTGANEPDPNSLSDEFCKPLEPRDGVVSELHRWFNVPSEDSARIQEVHKLLLHTIAEGIEEACR